MDHENRPLLLLSLSHDAKNHLGISGLALTEIQLTMLSNHLQLTQVAGC